MKNIPSPKSFIDFGFYYLIAASLQRRVFTVGQYNLYPNQYVILVAEPGIGKGLVIRTVSELLSFHKKESVLQQVKQIDPELVEAIHEAERAAAEQGQVYKSKFEERLLIPMASNATTYEALVHYTSKSIRHINIKKWDETLQKDIVGVYAHSSIAFCLGEMSSLFRKHMEDLVNFLIDAYDGEDYRYTTITRSTDFVKRPCINLFGGTQPDFIRRVFSDTLLTDGFASRSWFVVENENRFESIRIPELDTEQLQARFDILNHIKKLTTLYGPVTISDESWIYLDKWWKGNREARNNTNPKLMSYYSRKNIHVIKLAMAIHFGESLEMTLNVHDFERAMIALNSIEAKMHLALEFDGKNPLSRVAKKVEEFLIKNGPHSRDELIAVFFNDCSVLQLGDVLQFLFISKKIFNEERRGKSVWISTTEFKIQERVIKNNIKIEQTQLTQEQIAEIQKQQANI